MSHTGCSEMDCTHSTCRIAHETLKNAAPDLLEACMEAMTYLEACSELSDAGTTLRMLNSVIMKAKGLRA